jgi:hypothetical protein
MPNYKGYAAEIPDSFLSSVQSLQGGIIDIIGKSSMTRNWFFRLTIGQRKTASSERNDPLANSVNVFQQM